MAIAAWALTGAASAATFTVNLTNVQFSPAELTIQAGDTVEFVNRDAFAHDVLFEAGFSTGGAGSMAAGANWSHTFSDNGTFRYRCQTHSDTFVGGMVGKIQVGPLPPPPKSPGLEVLGAVGALGAAVAVAGWRRRA